MSPLRLRLRVLAILGLPALSSCARSPNAVDGEPTVLEIPPIASASSTNTPEDDELDEQLFTHPAARAFDCGPDRTRAMVCGQMYGNARAPAKRPYELCGEAATQVSSEVILGRHPSPAPLDEALTTRFRKHKSSTTKSCCYSQCVDVKTMAAAAPLPPGYRSRLECIASMRRGTKHPAPERADCPAAVDFGGGPDGSFAAAFHEENTGWRTKWVRERTGFDDLNLCCYQVPVRYSRPVRGRPLRDSFGEVVVARSQPRDLWATTEQARVPASSATSAALAARWLRDAELEHASVASFAELTLSLLALGAPPELIAAAQAGAIDEVRHARRCYGLASLYGGVALGPGGLAIPAQAPTDAITVLVHTFRDGCIGETVAALVAARSAAGCTDPSVRAFLLEIAADEQRHAELAWRIIAWLLPQPGVREALSRELAGLRPEDTQPLPCPLALPCALALPSPLASHGVLSDAAERRIRDEVVREVVIPCAEALLAS